MSDQDEAAQWLSGITGHAEPEPDLTEPEPTLPRPDPSQGAAGDVPVVSSERAFVEWLQDGPSRRSVKW